MVSILGAAAALFAVSAPAANAAAEAAALPYCYGATYGANTVQVCAAENIGIGNGTVDPGASTDCIIKVPAATFTISGDIVRPPVIYPCRIAGQVITNVGPTGFVTSGDPLYPPSIVGVSVRYGGYDVGTLYVDGGTTPVGVDPLCVGGGCPVPTNAVLQLLTNITTQ